MADSPVQPNPSQATDDAAYSQSSPPTPDPSPAQEKRDVERKLRRARASLFTRLDELGRRAKKVKSAMDVQQIIRDHALPAAGIAMLAGAVLGFPKRGGGNGQGFVGHQLTAIISALAGQALKASVGPWLLGQLRAASSSGSR